MTYNTNSSIIGVDLDNTSTTQLFALGTHCLGNNNSEWVYVQASTSVTAYKMVAFNNVYAMGMASGTDLIMGNQIGVAQTVFLAAAYGWVAIRGNSLGVMVTGSCTLTAQGIYLASSSMPTGMLGQSASGSGTMAGISFVSVNQTSTATVQGALLSWPRGNAPGL